MNIEITRDELTRILNALAFHHDYSNKDNTDLINKLTNKLGEDIYEDIVQDR